MSRHDISKGLKDMSEEELYKKQMELRKRFAKCFAVNRKVNREKEEVLEKLQLIQIEYASREREG